MMYENLSKEALVAALRYCAKTEGYGACLRCPVNDDRDKNYECSAKLMEQAADMLEGKDEAALANDLIEFCRRDEQNREPRPLRNRLIAKAFRQILQGDREISDWATNFSTGEVFFKLSFTEKEGTDDVHI